MKSWGYLLLSVPCGIAALYGCAEAPEDEPLYGILATDPADAGEKGTSIKLPESGDDDDDTTSSSSSSSSGTTPPKDAGSTTPPPPKDAGPPPPPPNDPCTKNTCGSSKDLGAIAGDTGAPVKNVTGAASRWLHLRVEEQVTGIFASGRKLSVKATLVSPPGHNFDLFVYRPDNDVKECSAVRKSSEATTGDDVVSINWGEGADPNGASDSRFVTFEVRDIDGTGTCDPTATWQLKVEGNK